MLCRSIFGVLAHTRACQPSPPWPMRAPTSELPVSLACLVFFGSAPPPHPQMKPHLDRDPVLLTRGSWAQQGRCSPVISSRCVCFSLRVCICRLHMGERGAPASCILYESATELAPLVKRSPVPLICNPESVVNQVSRVCVSGPSIPLH